MNSMRPGSTISLGRRLVGRPRRRMNGSCQQEVISPRVSVFRNIAFLEKLLNLQKRIHPEPVKNSTEPKDVEEVDSNNCMEAEVSVVVDDNIRELPNHMALDTPSAKPKSTGKSPPLSRSSTLMKPTASQLAKQNHRREIHSNRLLRRKLDEKSQNSPPPTKRHKLEAGYVRKVAEQLKHQHLWLHKVSKKEPNLETANRAQRPLHITLIFRYKVNAKPGEQSKILRAPPWPSPKKLTIPATEFQMFRLRTSARVMQQTYDHHVTNGPNSSYLSENETTEIEGGMVYKFVACSLKNKELKFAIDKRCRKEPPTDLFSKLSLESEGQHNTKPQSKNAFAC
ncbi:protein TPX2 [Pyrus ussuriensis x Pyrus communis]|uniref:Protein TPX2 n=1 Tax=Pyrus ussuriensis x Pyrus communis TaxID=2448454 RepID=A0A5N5F0U8_9ROSA|nr:protein TPX2 [Pyrus ussuriensis x Pyrus communis]